MGFVDNGIMCAIAGLLNCALVVLIMKQNGALKCYNSDELSPKIFSAFFVYFLMAPIIYLLLLLPILDLLGAPLNWFACVFFALFVGMIWSFTVQKLFGTTFIFSLKKNSDECGGMNHYIAGICTLVTFGAWGSIALYRRKGPAPGSKTKSTKKASKDELDAWSTRPYPDIVSATRTSSRKNPFIKSLKWGQIKIDFQDSESQFKDVVISPNNIMAWDWKTDGTRHQPGITVKAVEKIIDECDTIILSQGVLKKLQISPELQAKINEGAGKFKDKTFHILPTNEAAEKYNELADTTDSKVGALIHTTCESCSTPYLRAHNKFFEDDLAK